MRQQTALLLAGLGTVGLYLWLRSRATASDPTGGASDFIGGTVDTLSVAGSRMTAALSSRGYRNNNPGNIRYIRVNPWNGQTGNDNGYGIYDTPQNGTRALGHQLLSYAGRGLDTVAKIINVWAPPSENLTSAYVTDVASQMALGTDEPFDVNARLPDLCTAIARHENGYLDSSFDMSWCYL